MTEIDIAIRREFDVAAPLETTFKFLADTPATLEHYPKLQKLVDLGNKCWRWELEPVGLKGISHQLIYSVRYEFNPEDGRIAWTPLKAEKDNANIRGRFEITGSSQGSHIILDTDGSLTLPVPKLLGMAAKPMVEREFVQQIDGFIANLKGAIGTSA